MGDLRGCPLEIISATGAANPADGVEINSGVLIGRHRVGDNVGNRCHVESDGVGGGVGIDAAIENAAIVADLEGEGGNTGAIVVEGGSPGEIGNLGERDHLASSDGNAGQRQGAAGRHSGDGDRLQRVAFDGIAEAEIGRREGVGRVFGGRKCGIGARGRVIHRIDRNIPRIHIRQCPARAGVAAIRGGHGEGDGAAGIGHGNVKWG